ncbi:hypothetical protein [Actinoplanes sp. HUAS TT8]|uniref:hypothetical protein n=1 Tax=Actinoplanes sp. HUAS TT8 TaxID=3447453 RepID=UPI003F51D27E
MTILATDDQHVGHRFGPRVRRWIAVFVVALTFAALLGAGGAWLGWRGAPALPDDQRAREIVAAIVPGMRVGEVERHDVIFGDPDPMSSQLIAGTDEYDAGSVTLEPAGSASDAEEEPDAVETPVFAAALDVAGARAALERDGWEIRSGTTVRSVTARRGSLELTVYQDNGPGGVVFHRPEPALVRVLALVGWGAGLLLGGWIGLRFSRRSKPGAARILGRTGTVLLLTSTMAVTAGLLLPWPPPIPPDGPDALWEPYVAVPWKPFVLIALACWTLAAVLRWSPARRAA